MLRYTLTVDAWSGETCGVCESSCRACGACHPAASGAESGAGSGAGSVGADEGSAYRASWSGEKRGDWRGDDRPVVSWHQRTFLGILVEEQTFLY